MRLHQRECLEDSGTAAFDAAGDVDDEPPPARRFASSRTWTARAAAGSVPPIRTVGTPSIAVLRTWRRSVPPNEDPDHRGRRERRGPEAD